MTNHSTLMQVLFSTPEFSHSLDPFLTLPGRTAALENVVTSTEDVDRESHMIRAACHCTTVRMEIEETPTWVTDCNCTLCRRYGALWAYYEADQVKLVQGVDATDTYLWGPSGSLSIAAMSAVASLITLCSARIRHGFAVSMRG